MTGHTALSIWSLQRIGKKRRIAHNGIIRALMLLHPFMHDAHTCCKRRSNSVGCCLPTSTFVNINTYDGSIGIALGNHQCYDTRTRADIEYATPSTSPCSQQHTIGAYLHGTQLLRDGKMLESEHSQNDKNSCKDTKK